MNKLIAALSSAWTVAGALFVGGCATDGLPLADMAKLTVDASALPDQGSTHGRFGCGALVICYADCATAAATQAEFDFCQASCDKRSKVGSAAKYEAALACGQSHCLGDVDAGLGKCVLAADHMTLVNADGTAITDTDPGTAPRECGVCLKYALAALLSGGCNPADSPDCHPAECVAVTNTCLNEM